VKIVLDTNVLIAALIARGVCHDLLEHCVLRSRMKIVTPSKLESQVCRDPDDDNILAAAVSGNCDCIITGDKDLLVLGRYEGVAIFRPRDFLMKEGIE
jgi:predicted nucleic acid-binding protein